MADEKDDKTAEISDEELDQVEGGFAHMSSFKSTTAGMADMKIGGITVADVKPDGFDTEGKTASRPADTAHGSRLTDVQFKTTSGKHFNKG
ncbi:MAG: hypothetical protein AAGK00_11465 [Pseudomonadota bacterium]